MGKRDRGMERDYQGRFTSFKRAVKWFAKRVILSFSFIVLLAFVYAYGATANPIVKAEVIDGPIPPVLERIMNCESKGQQFGKSGQVLMSPNVNGTVDLGIAQINTVWFAKATELGYDLTKEEDNIKMATWIYENKGTGPWSSSAKCWSK